MKKKHLIGALVLGMALCASCTMPVISTRERVLASSQTQNQQVEFKITKLSPAGYSTVKGVLDKATANYLKNSNNWNNYKYCWVDDTSKLPDNSSQDWKAIQLKGENQDSLIEFIGAEPNKYLVIKKMTDGKNVVYTSDKITYTRDTFNATPSIIYSKENDTSGSYRMPFEGIADTLEYRVKFPQETETETEYDEGETWISADSYNGISITLASTNQENVFYYVRKKATEEKFASKPITVEITNLNSDGKINFDVIKGLTYTFENGQLSISGLEKLEGKTSSLTYSKITENSIEKESTQIPYGSNNSDTFSAEKEKGIAIKSDGIIVLYFLFHLDRNFSEDEKEVIKQKEKSKDIIGLNGSISYEYKKKGENNYTAVNNGNTTLTVSEYGTYHIRKKASEKNITITNEAAIYLYLPSKDLEVTVGAPVHPLIYYPDLFEPQVDGEEAKKAEEAKQTEEAKKAEETKQAEEAKKAEKAKQAEEAKKAEEAKQTEEMKKPVLQSVQAKKKTGATVSSKKIKAILNAHSGKLTVTTKNAEVSLSKKVLDAVFGFEAEPLKVSVKTEVLKKDSKEERTITKNKGQLVSRNIYHLSVKVGKESLNDYDLQGGKLVVTLKTNLKKAPKKLYAMNLATGKKVKASFKAGEVSFTSDIEGKFVLVTK